MSMLSDINKKWWDGLINMKDIKDWYCTIPCGPKTSIDLTSYRPGAGISSTFLSASLFPIITPRASCRRFVKHRRREN